LEIRNGQLLGVFGKSAEFAGLTLMPADVELEGGSFGLDYCLSDHVGEANPTILRHPLSGQFDAAWVRARIPRVFEFTPDLSEAEKSLLYVGFVAVIEDTLVGIPFICTDHYGRSGLLFSEKGPEETLKQTIASAFWSLLLHVPEDLADFEGRVYHPGTGVWLNYGCKLGHIYCEEEAG
jgi:hypothetical protein